MIGTVAQLRRYLTSSGGGGGNDSDEQLLEDILAAASARVVELAADRTLEPLPAEGDAPVTFTFALASPVLQVPDLREVTAITIDDVAYPGGYDLLGRRGQPAWWISLYEWPTTYLSVGRGGRLAITGSWGPDEVQPHVLEAVLTWAARVYHERAARYADSRTDLDGGVSSYFRSIPPAIKGTIDALQIPGI